MLLKFVKFYKGMDDLAYSVSEDGLVFRFFVGSGFGFEHVEKLPDGAKEITAKEWAAAQLPEAVAFHVAGKKEAEAEREITPEEKALDAKYHADVREWLARRNGFIGDALKMSSSPAVEITETTTREYGSPLLVDAFAALVGFGVQEPEDPIEWRRAARKGQLADVIRDMIPSVMEVVGQMVNAKVAAKVTRSAAPQAAPPQPQQRPAPKPPAEPKAEEKGPEAGK